MREREVEGRKKMGRGRAWFSFDRPGTGEAKKIMNAPLPWSPAPRTCTATTATTPPACAMPARTGARDAGSSRVSPPEAVPRATPAGEPAAVTTRSTLPSASVKAVEGDRVVAGAGSVSHRGTRRQPAWGVDTIFFVGGVERERARPGRGLVLSPFAPMRGSWGARPPLSLARFRLSHTLQRPTCRRPSAQPSIAWPTAPQHRAPGPLLDLATASPPPPRGVCVLRKQ